MRESLVFREQFQYETFAAFEAVRSMLTVLEPEDARFPPADRMRDAARLLLGSAQGGGRCVVCQSPVRRWEIDARGILVEHAGRAYPCRVPIWPHR